ncbi:MAG: 50S ribosomal protein L35 [Fimbriimonadaceae bacterium]|nr:50S ribosomal protein L35 [Armatimonadota bacterium]
MPKLKTKKTAAKRFKITGTGKIMRRKAYNNHMFFNKSASQKRRLDMDAELKKTEEKRVRRLLGLA